MGTDSATASEDLRQDTLLMYDHNTSASMEVFTLISAPRYPRQLAFF